MTCHVKSMPFKRIYGFDKLEQRETCLIQWLYSLRKFAVRVYAGGLKITSLHIKRVYTN